MQKVQFAIVALGAACLSACGQTFDPQEIQGFSKAASALSASITETRQIQQLLARETEAEKAVVLYLRGADPDVVYPPKPGSTKAVGEVWNVRIAYARALADYGASLIKVTDGSVASNLGTAVDNLRKVVEIASPELAIQAGFTPAANFATRTAKFLIRKRNTAAILAQIRRAHPAIIAGSTLLKEDLAKIAFQAETRYQAWLIAKRASLKDVQNSIKPPPLDQYAIYKKFIADNDAMITSIKLLLPPPGSKKPPYVGILDTMVKAHAALLEPNPDPMIIDEFMGAVGDIADIVKATE